MNTETISAINRVAEVVMFENWLRFYFLSEEEDGKLFLRLPEKALRQLQDRYTDLYGLAEYLNGSEVRHEDSVKAVCLFVSGGLGGPALPDGMVADVFDSPGFHLELQLFGTWVQGHEDKLDEGFLEFSRWRELYAGWKETDEVRAYREGLSREQTGPISNVH